MDTIFNDPALSTWCNEGNFVVLLGAVSKEITRSGRNINGLHFPQKCKESWCWLFLASPLNYDSVCLTPLIIAWRQQGCFQLLLINKSLVFLLLSSRKATQTCDLKLASELWKIKILNANILFQTSAVCAFLVTRILGHRFPICCSYKQKEERHPSESPA